MPGFGFDGFGILEVVWLLVVVAIWGLIIVGLVFGVRWLIRADRNSRLPGGSVGGRGPDDPLEILRQRYARGEIDEEEYERRRRTLTGS